MISSLQLINTCACTRLRTAARLVTRAYDDALRPSGINASQLAIMAAIDVSEAGSISELSNRLAVDRTTLSRNLKPLESAGYVRLGDEGWKRSKTVHMTAEGQRVLTEAKILWSAAQADFLDRVGAAEWQGIERGLKRIAELY
ncbi:hypothetical protein RLDS_01740 [Sphingobium lactosutens DS20]|uniref:HTH marR-type domain-containing protein n=3 Tax=Sphingobium TaxID=165695 RepID=A0A8E0WNY1_9SPHN|nr:MarR family transcriptional regulator [Sphingobium indicum]EQB18663.1 hypothetical protein RLDS_01740 [Sphingobium lactosutens DS20]KER34751.1 hypothetical protein AL00_19505 [Sphingobium indicum F2]